MSKPTTFITNKGEPPYQDRPASVVQRQRFCFVKDGQASPWYEKPDKQVCAIARKHFGLTHQLWRLLVKSGRIRSNRQIFHEESRTWRHTT